MCLLYSFICFFGVSDNFDGFTQRKSTDKLSCINTKTGNSAETTPLYTETRLSRITASEECCAVSYDQLWSAELGLPAAVYASQEYTRIREDTRRLQYPLPGPHMADIVYKFFPLGLYNAS